MTSKPLVRRTLATLRSAEFGFFGVVVYTRVQTPRFCGDCCSAGTFLRDFCTTRGLAISWLIVGIVHPCSRETGIGLANSFGATAPSVRSHRRLHASKRLRKTNSRQPLVAERKALRRHRGPRFRQPARAVWLAPRSCIRNQSRENLLKRTKIVLALPDFDRQRLSGIRRGWCPSRSSKTK